MFENNWLFLMCYCFLFGLFSKSTMLQYQQCLKVLCQIFQHFFHDCKTDKKKKKHLKNVHCGVLSGKTLGFPRK